MSAYYNEIEPFGCGVLRRRIADGSLPAGEIDERDIRQVQPDELVGFEQWHLFAGIAGISLGLRLAGVPDDFPVLTGGFPCVDVSLAGRGAGIGTADDPTDRSGLWWEMLRIIRGVRPRYVVVENVPALRTRGADAVIASLEGAGYRLFCPVDFWPGLEVEPEAHIPGPLVVGAWAVGAPHRRDRVWLVAHRDDSRESQSQRRIGEQRRRTEHGGERGLADAGRSNATSGGDRADGTGGLAYANVSNRSDAGRSETASGFEFRGEGMADASRIGSAGRGELGDVARAAREAERDGEQRERLRYAADNGDSDGAGELADATGSIKSRLPFRACTQISDAGISCTNVAAAREEARQDAGGRGRRGGLGLDDSQYDRREWGQSEWNGAGSALFPDQARWPARPGQPQHDWEYARASLPPALLAIWHRMRARYPQSLRTPEQKRQAEKDFGLAWGALDIDADGLPGLVVGLRGFRNDALTAIGNAVVPLVVAVIGRALLNSERRRSESA